MKLGDPREGLRDSPQCGAEGNPPNVGLRKGSEYREDPRGKGVQDFGGAEHPGVTASCSVRCPCPKESSALCPPLASGRDRRREETRESHEHPSGEQLAGEGERWGKCLTLWCQSKEGGLPVVDCAGA